MIALALWIGPAAAQMEACDGPFTMRDWTRAMDGIDDALVDLDGVRAEVLIDYVIDESRCLDERVPPANLGRLARQVSLVAFYAQDPEEVTYWALLARETAGGSPWPEGVPVPDRYHEFVRELPPPRVGEMDDGLGLMAPKGGGVLVDGTLVREPLATLGVEHLVQVADKKGRPVHTSWQTGVAFPEDWVTSDPTELDVPRWYEDPLPPPPIVDDGDAVAVAPEPLPEPEPVEPEPVAPEPVEPELSFEGDGRSDDCPWSGEPRKVAVTKKLVTVNRRTFAIETSDDHLAFQDTLRACGEFRAARRFDRWQAARKKLFGGKANLYRDRMVIALKTLEPRREKRVMKSGGDKTPAPE